MFWLSFQIKAYRAFCRGFQFCPSPAPQWKAYRVDVQCRAVERHPGKVSGAWVFRDTRLPVATVIENFEDLSMEESWGKYDVTREQINAVLKFAAQRLRDAPSPPPTLHDAHLV